MSTVSGGSGGIFEVIGFHEYPGRAGLFRLDEYVSRFAEIRVPARDETAPDEDGVTGRGPADGEAQRPPAAV